MEGGHIKMQGTPEEIFASENERVKEFIGKLNAWSDAIACKEHGETDVSFKYKLSNGG